MSHDSASLDLERPAAFDAGVADVTPRYDVPNPAPPPLRLVQEFVNSIDHERGLDWIAEPGDLARWLAEHEIAADQPPTPAHVEHARRTREAVRELLLANNGEGEATRAVETLNDAARRARLVPQLAPDGHGAHLEPLAAGADASLGRIVAVVFESLGDDAWPRLKACRKCTWAFYDYSRNRAATWCSMKLCGNRTKTRAYRRRQRTR